MHICNVGPMAYVTRIKFVICHLSFVTMQGLRLAAINDVEKTKLRRKICQSQWTVKYGSRSAGQGACLKGMSRRITMQC